MLEYSCVSTLLASSFYVAFSFFFFFLFFVVFLVSFIFFFFIYLKIEIFKDGFSL